MKTLKYQEKYITKIVINALDDLNDKYKEQSIIVFKAPTGSGKTYMISQALSKIVKGYRKPLSFFWISVNSLHEQSRRGLTRYLEEEKLLECISIDEIQNNVVEKNEIVFINWDSLNKKNSVFMLDNEKDWNLESIVLNTKEEDREIILIIDESHRAAKTSKAMEIINVISPRLTIELTATPREIKGTLIEIPLAEVIDEGMIKKEVQINPGANQIKENKDLLDVALKKRNSLKKAYESLNSNINPLLMIQIPNKRAGETTNPEDYIINLLTDRKITTKNGKLAIWLSESKENKDEIEINDNQVEVLVFKEAIALGWDCPRAAILYLQREWKQKQYVFNIQTLGRIMRMPDQMHYDNKPELNIGYVYSASDNFEIVQELADDYVSVLQLNRDEIIYKKPVRLLSEYIRRKRELTRLSGDFKECLYKAADEMKIKDNINVNIKEINKIIGLNGATSAIDDTQSVTFKDQIQVRKDVKEISDSYGRFCITMSEPYSKARSSQIIKSAIRSWFKDVFKKNDEDEISMIVMHPNNNHAFQQLLEKAKDIYQNLPIKEEEVIKDEAWEVPESMSIFSDYSAIGNSRKSIMKQNEDGLFYVKKNKNGKIDLSKPEMEFIDLLDKTDDEVQWWYKNSTNESKYFGIAYKKHNGFLYAFYPDFIIRLKKESIIVEIKDNNDLKPENGLKLLAGRDYVKRANISEKVRFFMLSPFDYHKFFILLQEQELDKFESVYEDRLSKYCSSQSVVSKKNTDKTDSDTIDDEFLHEFDKALRDNEEQKKYISFLEQTNEEAKQTIQSLMEAGYEVKQEKAEKVDIQIPSPFNICILGEVADKEEARSSIQSYFSKHGMRAKDWDIDFLDNRKLRNADVLKSLRKDQSRYNLLITGQIHSHVGKGNTKSNLLTELKKEKYVTHLVGSKPDEMLTTNSLIDILDNYISIKA